MSRRAGTEGQHKDPPASLIREIPRDERPRERLLRCGPQALSDAELLAILLRSGRPGASVLELARELLRQNGGLAGLLGAGGRRPGNSTGTGVRGGWAASCGLTCPRR